MKNKNPLISIIMNCFNGEKYLRKSIKSIVNQSYRNWELIFWDNQSTDKSKTIVLNFRDRRIKYFKSKKFTSLYEARNLAIKKSLGDYVCFLDVDDWWKKEKLIKQIQLFQKNQNLNFLFSNFFIYDQKTKSKKTCFPDKIPDGKITQLLLDNYKIGILTVMMKKSLFIKKKFNNKYNIIGDFDFFLNLSKKIDFYSLSEPLAFYRLHSNNYSNNTLNYIKELKIWINENNKKYAKNKFSFFKLKKYYYKLLLKYFFKNGIIAHW